MSGDFGNTYGIALRDSLQRALALDSKVPSWILDLEGMSGRLYRRLVNNLLGDLRSARYLEVGSWAGSTSCAAMIGNAGKITCIDNWSQFEGPRDAFLQNTNRARGDTIDFTFVESDFRQVAFDTLGSFNVYLFDGPHAYEDQYDGILLAQPALDGIYIQIVDDWNWPHVREGTRDAISRIGLREICALEIRSTQDDTHPTQAVRENSAWHNGYYLAVLAQS